MFEDRDDAEKEQVMESKCLDGCQSTQTISTRISTSGSDTQQTLGIRTHDLG